MRDHTIFGTRSKAGLALAAVIGCLFVSASLGFSEDDPEPGTGGGSDPDLVYENSEWWAQCVGDAPCPATESGACAALTPGSTCYFCDVAGPRQKCVFAWTTDCLYTDVGSKKHGCGHRKTGSCQGGGVGVVCLGTYDDGYCEQIKCTTR